MANPSMAHQIKQLEKKLKQYSEKEVPRAVVVALNKVTKPLVGIIAKGVSEKEKVPAKLIRKQVVFNKATFNRRSTYIKSFARGINAIRLLSPASIQRNMGRGTSKAGVTVKGRLFAGAFINRTRRSGNAFVFDRRFNNKRNPIDVKRISIDEALLEIQPRMARDRFAEKFNSFYVHELQYRISKYAQ